MRVVNGDGASWSFLLDWVWSLPCLINDYSYINYWDLIDVTLAAEDAITNETCWNCCSRWCWRRVGARWQLGNAVSQFGIWSKPKVTSCLACLVSYCENQLSGPLCLTQCLDLKHQSNQIRFIWSQNSSNNHILITPPQPHRDADPSSCESP